MCKVNCSLIFWVAALLLIGTGLSSLSIAENALSVATVQKLYHDFAWEANEDGTASGHILLIEQPEAVLKTYFTPQLAKFFIEDRRCAMRTKEICRLDFQPLWASQDPGALDLKIEAGKEQNEVMVQYKYPGNGELIRMKYILVNTLSGWRISDIHYQAGFSLLGVFGIKKK